MILVTAAGKIRHTKAGHDCFLPKYTVMSWFAKLTRQYWSNLIHLAASNIRTADIAGEIGLPYNVLFRAIQGSIAASIGKDYEKEWSLQGPRGTGGMDKDTAVEMLARAIIELADKDDRIGAKLARELARSHAEGYDPTIDIELESKSPPTLGVTVGLANQLIDAPTFTGYLAYTPHLESHIQVNRSNRKQRQTGYMPVDIDPAQMPGSWSGRDRMALASEIGYLMRYTWMSIDSPQVMLKFRDAVGEGSFLDDEGTMQDRFRPKGQHWDKQGPSWEFQIGGPEGDEPFEWLHPFRSPRGAKYSRKEAFDSLLDFIGLGMAIDTTPPPWNSGQKVIDLKQYRNHALEKLLKNKPADVTDEQMEMAFNEGWQGRILGRTIPA